MLKQIIAPPSYLPGTTVKFYRVCVCVCVCVLSRSVVSDPRQPYGLIGCVRLYLPLGDPPGSSVHGILEARILE